MRISDWSSDVCSSDLHAQVDTQGRVETDGRQHDRKAARGFRQGLGQGQARARGLTSLPSLRAKRSNPERFTPALACFASLAMTNILPRLQVLPALPQTPPSRFCTYAPMLRCAS